MDRKIQIIDEAITRFAGASIISPFVQEEGKIFGRISLTEQTVTLLFDVEINSQYPFQFHDSESIRFINKDLLEYEHINFDGSVCVHTLHHPELSEKVFLDLNGLKQWIIRYYINGEKDKKYEHIVVNSKPVNGVNGVFLFTDVNYKFTKGLYGLFTYSFLSSGFWSKEKYDSLLVQTFIIGKQQIACNWSKFYK